MEIIEAFRKSPHPRDLQPFLDRLEELGIALPDEMLKQVRADGEGDIGNRIVHHN